MDESVPQQYLHTVTRKVTPSSVTIADGHTHVWIDDVGAVDPNPMILNEIVAIERELLDFRAAGGQLLVDCQPGGCGRNGEKLRQLSERTDVRIIACTGFHLRRYYPPIAPIFAMDIETAYRHFVEELMDGLAEAPHIRAGFIKIACEAALNQSPQTLIEAAVRASLTTGAAIEVHTERGQDAEAIIRFMLDLGMFPEKLIICHVDKAPDFAQHQRLAAYGVRLEYDTFLRPKYHPAENVWPLLLQMIEAGYEDHLLLATDLADAKMWQHIGGGAGAVALITEIKQELTNYGLPGSTIQKLIGSNVVQSLMI